jgi:hypothetical protein
MIEDQSLIDITDFKRYVVETNGTRFFALSIALSCGSADEERRGTD